MACLLIFTLKLLVVTWTQTRHPSDFNTSALLWFQQGLPLMLGRWGWKWRTCDSSGCNSPTRTEDIGRILSAPLGCSLPGSKGCMQDHQRVTIKDHLSKRNKTVTKPWNIIFYNILPMLIYSQKACRNLSDYILLYFDFIQPLSIFVVQDSFRFSSWCSWINGWQLWPAKMHQLSLQFWVIDQVGLCTPPQSCRGNWRGDPLFSFWFIFGLLFQ